MGSPGLETLSRQWLPCFRRVTPTPPPGLSVTELEESSYRLTLRREQLLVLVSDGVDDEEAFRCCCAGTDLSPEELATQLLSFSRMDGQDDALDAKHGGGHLPGGARLLVFLEVPAEGIVICQGQNSRIV